MPKHRKRRNSSREDLSSPSRKKRRRHHESTREKARNPSNSPPNLFGHAPGNISSQQHVRLLETFNEFLVFMKNRELPAGTAVPQKHDRSANLVSLAGISTDSGDVSHTPERLADEQTTSNGRGSEPGSADVLSPARTNNVVFNDTIIMDTSKTNAIGETTGPDSFVLELFGEQIQRPPTASWLPGILSTAKTDVRTGLKNELRDALLVKYEPKEDLVFLSPPKLNGEILPNLGSTARVRDKHQLQAQAQVGASLNAIGSGFSDLANLEILQVSEEARNAATKLAEGIRLLADHHYRLSQARRAFIVPSLNFLAKTVSDAAVVDDCLFGANFAEQISTAQTVEKVARKMVRKSQPPTQSTQRQKNIQQKSKNPMGPPRRIPSTHQPRRDNSQHQSRSRRARSHSRPRTRR
ncbi:uncharacterized protein LOC120357712 [Solenopsis invicta]|uniref:uncharacterized protein LOC120357712 n=1 Tax=Solenopsis invicta TaxID=13686 RepID=UPI00193CD7D5|nr:uncharacterized protein LOC120357712 [Solenopsis invicta]